MTDIYTMNDIELITSRTLMIWMITVATIMYFLFNNHQGDSVFRYGPNPKFFILTICIDTYGKYNTVLTYCIINSAIRTMHHDILLTWTTNTLLNKQSELSFNRMQSYEMSMVCTVYIWFDYFLSFNILMAQFDMIIIEIITELAMTFCVTKYYIDHKTKKQIHKTSEKTHLLYG